MKPISRPSIKPFIKKSLTKTLSIILIMCALANLALFAFQKISVLFFWAIIIIIALLAWALPTFTKK